MRVQLDRRWIDHLRERPESGMGYHVVDIRLHSGQRVDGIIVVGSREAEWPVERGAISSRDIAWMELSQRPE